MLWQRRLACDPGREPNRFAFILSEVGWVAAREEARGRTVSNPGA